MRALVTGGTGFIGRHLVRRLVELGIGCRCLVRSTARGALVQGYGVELVVGDLSRAESAAEIARWIDGCDVVFHLAGMTSALRPSEMNRVNALASHQLLEACAKRLTPPLFLMVSSLAAAGTSPPGCWRDGREPARPISNYGRSKRGGERAAERFADKVPISIVRPGIVFGPENRETLPIFQSVCDFRVHAVPTWRPSRVALIHVEDLLDLLLAVMQRGDRLGEPAGASSGEGYYFAADPHCPGYIQWGRMIARAAGLPPPLIVMVPECFLWPAAAVSVLVQARRGKSDNFNLDKIREATAGHWVCRTAPGYRQLGFQHRRSLSERLRDTVQWYREEGWIRGPLRTRWRRSAS